MLKWLTGVLLACAMVLPAQAVTLLRDAELEQGLKQIASPVLRAAGLNASRVKILVVKDASLNAFVISNDAIFIHSGLLTRMERADMLQAVIAHEAAHIANGHIARRLTNLKATRTAVGLGIALGAIAAASGAGEATGGVVAGVQSAALRRFLSHTRAEESSADQSALQFMRSANVPTVGMLDVMKIFRGQDVLNERRQDPYVRSHPLSRDRVRAVEANINARGKGGQADPSTSYWFARVKGKLNAELRAPSWTLRRAGESGYKDVALMRQAIAHHRNSRTKRALAAIDQAIALRPNDPYFHVLRGEILIDTRNFQAGANSYARAVRLAPHDGVILSGYGRALLASGQINAARKNLEAARSVDFRDGIMLRDLATAYAKSGQPAMASLVTAERFALRGRLKDAGIHAKRASQRLPRGSGPWQRAQDVLFAAERAAKQRK